VLGDGKQSKPYVYVEDCLDGIEFGHAHSNEEVNYFNLTVDGWTSVAQIAEATLRAMKLEGVPIVYAGGSRGWRGDIPTVRLDGTKIKTLGWAPKLTSGEAVERAAFDAVAKYGNRS
jgi:UDP-glucose 4-epimerase